MRTTTNTNQRNRKLARNRPAATPSTISQITPNAPAFSKAKASSTRMFSLRRFAQTFDSPEHKIAGQQSSMAKNRNAGVDQSFNLRGQNGPTFNFHSLDPRLLHQTARASNKTPNSSCAKANGISATRSALGFARATAAAWCRSCPRSQAPSSRNQAEWCQRNRRPISNRLPHYLHSGRSPHRMLSPQLRGVHLC